jgi:polyisoprenoid-binding protein YceI
MRANELISTTVRRRPLRTAVALLSLSLCGTTVLEAGNEATVQIQRGTATFDASTNVAAISVHGRSTALEGRARIRHAVDGLVIENLEATVPVKTLNTGVSLRDEHMRKAVFTTSAGLVPNMRFTAERSKCSPAGRAWRCQLSGSLTIRDVSRPLTLGVVVSGESERFRAVGDGRLRLSAYGIVPPSQFGVTTQDLVRLHVEFVAQRVEEQVARVSR